MQKDVTRRNFILGTAVIAAGLVGCGGSKNGPTKITTPTTSASDSLNVLLSSGPIAAGIEQRIAFVLMSDEFIDPKRVKASFGNDQGDTSLGGKTCKIYRDAQAAPAYMVVRHVFSKPGTYWMRVTADGKTADSPIEVLATNNVAGAGKPLPAVDTPTTIDPRGVDPICTQNPPCPLHDVSLVDALSKPVPIALLFATPRFCQSSTCGPVLDVLLEHVSAYGARVKFLHAEVYRDLSAKVLAPAVQSFKLPSEPVLFVTAADGKIIDRLDGVFGVSELQGLLDRATRT